MLTLSQHLLEKLNVLVVLVKPNGRILHVSENIKPLLGYDAQNIIDDYWYNFILGTRYEINRDILFTANFFKSNKEITHITLEREMLALNKSKKYFLWNISKTDDGSIIAIGNDISDKKHAEQKLKLNLEILKRKNNDIIDSIQYAKRLQDAILPDIQKLKNLFAGVFTYYKPKDIISGDFYFSFVQNNKAYIAIADCTGHGVPGALLSVMFSTIIKQVIKQHSDLHPALLLKLIDDEVNARLEETCENEKPKDGMDLALCVYEPHKSLLHYSGAFRPLVMVRNDYCEEFSASRYPIGQYDTGIKKEFIAHSIPCKKRDNFYMFSDGYADQFGGERDKKFNKKQFLHLLRSIAYMPVVEQESFLDYAHKNWKQNTEQTDDILVLGFKI